MFGFYLAIAKYPVFFGAAFSYAFAMEVEHFTWLLPPDAWRKRPTPSRFKLTREQAAKRYPGATPIVESREVRIESEAKLIPGGSPYGQ